MEEQLITPEHISTELEAAPPRNPDSETSAAATTTMGVPSSAAKKIEDVFAAIRDASVYADKGIISIGDFQYVRRAIFIKGERIRNPFMSHLFKAMVDNIIVYSIVNYTLPPARLLKQWQSDHMFSMLPDGRTPPVHKDWTRELQDDDGVPPPLKARRDAENDASYKVKVTIRPVRSKSITPNNVPPYIQLPRISYANVAASLDLSSLPQGLHDYVARLISHIGDEYAHNEPFTPNHAVYKVLCRSLEADGGATAYKPDAETVANVIQPRVHRQRAVEIFRFDDDALEETAETQAAATAFDATKRLELTPYDRFFYKYFYGKQHIDSTQYTNALVSEHATSSLERAIEDEKQRKERERVEWEAKGVEMVKKAMLEQRERELRLATKRAAVKDDDDVYASPMPTPDQLGAAAEMAVANATWQQRMQEQEQQQQQKRRRIAPQPQSKQPRRQQQQPQQQRQGRKKDKATTR